MSGSSGFIGTKLSDALGRRSGPDKRAIDITDRVSLDRAARSWNCHTVVHLASSGTVITPQGRLPAMFDVAVDGLVNLLEVCRPSRFVFTSTCAVYGNAPQSGGKPGWTDVRPISVYGLSKVVGERILDEWASREPDSRPSAVSLRLGNVIGRGCRGLIAHLVRHAVQHPRGERIMEMRGGGKLLRDYVPIDYVTQIIEGAALRDWTPGRLHIYNVGSGRPMTNGAVAELVTGWLREQGLLLNIRFLDQAGPGETLASALDVAETERQFGIEPPPTDAVERAILEGAEECFERETAEASMQRAHR